MSRAGRRKGAKTLYTFTHQDKRANIPTNELRGFMEEEEKAPQSLLYPRDPSLDPQLVWRGKDDQDREELAVPLVPVYIQEKIHPQAIVEAITAEAKGKAEPQADLFADFNGIDFEQKVEFYRHEQNWSNRLILGDSLLVMASLAEKEGLKGKVQMIYLDPPYGIKFGSNWQVSTRKREVKDGKAEDASREPEVVKAFRDTWELGIHSYLTYLRDRFIAARELLNETGSIFVQIGDENAHVVRSILDEIFGPENFCGQIAFTKTSGQTSALLSSTFDYLLWYSKSKRDVKFRKIYEDRPPIENPTERYIFVETKAGCLIDLSLAQKRGQKPIPEGRILKLLDTTSQTGSDSSRFVYEFHGGNFQPRGSRGWSTNRNGLDRVATAGYLHRQGNHIWWKSYRDIFQYKARTTFWSDTRTKCPSGDFVSQMSRLVGERPLEGAG